MNPLDGILQFIQGARNAGMPDKLIYQTIQIAMIDELISEQGLPPKITPKPTPKRIGF